MIVIRVKKRLGGDIDMKALVINLATATDRMEFQIKQLNGLGIEFERLSAVSIDDLEEGIYQKYESTWERPLRKSEVACFFSHKNAWEEVIRNDQPMLILEDDAFLSQTTPCLLEELINIREIDYATLEVRGRKKIIAKNATYELCESSLIRLYQDRTGAAGYVLWPSGAKKLIERLNRGKIALADAFISSTYSLEAYQIEPAPIVQLDQCINYKLVSLLETESAISSEAKPIVRAARHWSYRIKRIFGQLKMGSRHLFVLHKSTRRYVRLKPRGYISEQYND